MNDKRSVADARNSVRHLSEFFAGDRAADISADLFRAYIARRQNESASNASINRELAALKRMFSLASHAGNVSRRPHIPTLEESNARQGFLDHGNFLAQREKFPDYLKDPATFRYISGWRTPFHICSELGVLIPN